MDINFLKVLEKDLATMAPRQKSLIVFGMAKQLGFKRGCIVLMDGNEEAIINEWGLSGYGPVKALLDEAEKNNKIINKII